MARRVLWLVIGLLALTSPLPAAQNDESPIEKARRLHQSGKLDEAFLTYLTIPGCQYLAAQIARPKAEHFLTVLREHATEMPPLSARLLEADLLLADGKRHEALAFYRSVAKAFNGNVKKDDQTLVLITEGYFVEPPANPNVPFPGYPATPFAAGPGSHRDNWLLRRFISLGAVDDASTEFARVWEIHRRNAQPYLADVVVGFNDKPVRERKLIYRTQFDGRGLQYALHYAFFLKQQDNLEKALQVLGEPLLAIDMDRDPNHLVYSKVGQDDERRYPLRNHVRPIQPQMYYWRSTSASRKEFIRLIYGLSKQVGEEDSLVEMLQKEISDGKNRLRRTLARIRYHQSRTDDALKMELDYIELADFDNLSAARRRGQAYEDAGKLAEAAKAYEQVLALPYTSPELPDADEATPSQYGAIQQFAPALAGRGPANRAQFHADVLRRLGRLYGSLGEPGRAFEMTLHEFEANPALLRDLETLGQARARAEALGWQEQFRTWLGGRVNAADPLSRANVCWLLADYAGCGRALGKAAKTYSYEQWRDRFRSVGKDQLRLFLAELLKVDPRNARVRLDLLDLEDDFAGPDVITLLESLLETDASFAFARGKGSRNRTRFRNYYDLAYRLLRLYEGRGESAKIVKLGLRILEGRKPFTRSPLNTPRVDWSDRSAAEDSLDCMYVMLAHVKRPADLDRITTLVDASQSIPLKNQLARLIPERRGRRIDPSEIHRRQVDRVELKTLGLPDDVRLLTHRDDVRSISPDGTWIGTSWGLVRYQPFRDNGLAILQIPLGVRVTAFCQTPAGLFVGTRAGVFRLDQPNGDKPSLTQIRLYTPDGSHSSRLRSTLGSKLSSTKVGPFGTVPVDDAFLGSFHAEQLLWWADALWLRDRDNVIRYEPKQRAARYYGRVPGRLFVANDTLWARAHVLDRVADQFNPIEGNGKEWHLIGATKGEIWADVNVDNDLRHRPALFDPRTHTLRILPIENTKPGEKFMVNGTFEVLAEDDQRVWLLGNNSHLTVYDREAGTLKLVRSSRDRSATPDAKHIGPAIWRPYAGRFYRLYCGSATQKYIPELNLNGDRGPYFCFRDSGGGHILLGSGIGRNWSEDNLGYDDESGMSHHIQDLEGGLFDIDARTLKWQKLGHRQGELSDFYVKRIYFDDRDKRAYVCTNGGVTILSLPDCKPSGRITVSDGLPSNKVEDVVRIGEKLYFACELGDEGGGLAVQDLNTNLIQRLSMTDGLKCNKIKRLRAEGTKLHILYGTLYGVRAYNTPLEDSEQAVGADSRVRTFRSSILNTETGQLSDGDEVLPASTPPNRRSWLPYLGGAVLFDVAHGGKRFIGGTHGLVIVPEGKRIQSGLAFEVENVTSLLSLRQQQLAEAAKVQVPRTISLSALNQLLGHKNPFVRANALAAAAQPVRNGDAAYTPVIGKFVSDPNDRVRSTAVWLLAATNDARAIEPLKIATKDRNRHIRSAAAITLARRGLLPRLALFEEILQNKDRYGNYPVAATSTASLAINAESVFLALAPLADPAVFDLLLRYPLPADDYEPRQKIFGWLGAQLRKHPEAAAGLLMAYTLPNDPGPDSNFGPARFAQEVFRYGGPPILPILHKALQSPDRVIRSNAARACGSVRHPSSIEPLIAALDLESGFSRGSIVWALGELKAQRALPQLVKLYIDARNDEKRRRGSGFRIAQAGAVTGNQFESLGNLDALRTDWDELKRASLPDPIDPRLHEKLLSPRMILDAVRKIGPTVSQSFYRQLAAAPDAEARSAAAARLAEGTAEDRTKNLLILRNLMGDSNTAVRAGAAVSLLLLGESNAERQIVAWLLSPEPGQRYDMLRQLSRIKDGRRLIFLRETLHTLARQSRNRYDIERLQQLLTRIPQG
jgi:HEAT repeat protein/tetratricopeptide (TPR) repeat protein